MSFVAILIASLLGSHHCAGMCGGFVAFYSGHQGKSLWPHVAYNGGRLVTYVILGAIAGSLGKSINQAGELAGFQQVVAVLLGALMILFGAKELLGIPTPGPVRALTLKIWGFVAKPLRLTLSSRDASPTRVALALGLLSTFLPCGWLYLFVAAAAATASPLSGAVLMGAFWLGTVPIMTALAGATKLLSNRLRLYLPRVTAILLIAAGIFSMSGHINKLFLSGRIDCHQATPATEHH